MILKLIVKSKAKCNSTELLLSENSHGVGRRHDNELRIQDGCVSGYHAELNRTPDGDYEIKDLDSSNGTFLNGKPISSPRKINAGDILKFGNLKVAVENHNEEVPLPETEVTPEKTPIKIVSLKDRFASAKKRKEHTSSISTDEETDGVSKETPSDEEDKEIEQTITELRKELTKKGHENSELSLRIKSAEKTESSLNSKVESLEAALSGRESEINTLKRASDRKGSHPKDLTSIQSELEEAQNALTERESELELLREELNRSESEFEAEHSNSGSGQDNIIHFDSGGTSIEEPQESLRAQLNALTASRDTAEEEARRLREELSRTREEPNGDESDKEKRLSFHITELESSLSGERLLHDDARLKNEQFRSKIQFLNSDLDNALEEISRLKATNARQFTIPEELNGTAAEAANLKQEIAISHEDNADLRTEIISLKSQLVAHQRELTEKKQDNARAESNTISQLRKQITGLNERIAETESLPENSEQEKTDLTRSLEDLQRQLETAEEAVQKSIEREVNLRQKNATLVDKVKEADSKASELSAQVKENASLTSKNDKLIKTLEKQLEKSESKTKAQQKLEDDLDSAEQLRLTAETEVSQLKEKLASTEAEAQSFKEQLNAAEEHCSELDSSLSAESDLTSERAGTIEQLREELSETSRKFESSEKELLEKHREELDALNCELQSSLTAGEKLKEELESVRSKLSSSQDHSAKEQTQLDSEHQAKQSELEEQLAQSTRIRDQIESAQDDLRIQLEERNERIADLVESAEDLEIKANRSDEEKEQLRTDLQLTRKGLSGALHSTQRRLAGANQNLDTEILHRDKVEKQLLKAKAALDDLRDEVESLRAESKEEIALSSEDTNLNRISGLMEEKDDEQKAFEARLEALSPSRKNGNGSARNGSFSEEEFYRHLVAKLDLVDALIERYKNKWRYTKITQQLALLKHAFVELLEEHSVSQLNLEPGTPLCLNQSNRIDLAPLEDGTQPKLKPFGKSEVVETVSPGYIFHDGSSDVVIRKAKVVVT